MARTIAFYFLLACFGIAALALVLVVLAALLISLAALVYRAIPGPNVPLTYNLRNLVVRWKNALVTAMALTLVVGIMVFMLAYVGGMYRLTEASGRPGNVVLLQDGATDEGFSNLPPTADVLKLDEKVRKQVLQMKIGGENRYLASKEVFVIVNQPIPNAPSSGKQRRFVQMRGVDNPLIAAKIHGIELQEGRWFSQEGVQRIQSTATTKTVDDTAFIAACGIAALAGIQEDRAIEVVLGAGMAGELGNDKVPPAPIQCGEMLDIGGRKWIVVGIMSTGSSTFASEVWTRDYLVQEQFGRRNSYSSYVIATRDAKSAQKMSKDMKEFKELAVSAQPETEYYAKLSATNEQFLYSIMFIAIVMAGAGALSVMITMFASISQRSKDIGVMRLLGYSRWQILVSFLLESVVIALIGGILGCAIGGFIANGLTATSIMSSGTGGGGKSVILKLVVDAKTLGTGLLFTLIMGSVGGLIPALSAMRLKPLESLR
jgi:putative ABC transport system permease protein